MEELQLSSGAGDIADRLTADERVRTRAMIREVD